LILKLNADKSLVETEGNGVASFGILSTSHRYQSDAYACLSNTAVGFGGDTFKTITFSIT